MNALPSLRFRLALTAVFFGALGATVALLHLAH